MAEGLAEEELAEVLAVVKWMELTVSLEAKSVAE